MQLDRHIGTHIRESPQAMHRTKLKDLAAQTYVRWQELLAHCQPQVVPPAAPTWEGREVVRQLTRDRACPPTVQLFSSWLGDGWRGQWGRGDACRPILIKSPMPNAGTCQEAGKALLWRGDSLGP